MTDVCSLVIAQVAAQFEAQRDDSWTVIDASPTPDELHKQVSKGQAQNILQPRATAYC